MFRNLQSIKVELTTAKGFAFIGYTDGVELQAINGVLAINPRSVSYMNILHISRITLRVGAEFTTYALENAAGGLQQGRLTIIAEDIQKMPPEVNQPEPPFGKQAA